MIALAYPVTAGGEPGRLNAASVARIAGELRWQIVGASSKPPSLETLVARTGRLRVNDVEIRLSWDLDGDVSDEAGRPVLGACLHEPEEPDTVMIYVNSKRLDGCPEVLRSTAAHELAHAVFDMPAALGGRARRAFRTRTDQARAKAGAPIDWAEWRADEFMGAFLVPPEQLARALAREASTFDLRLGWRADRNGRPTPFVDADARDLRVGWLADQLAEFFGVTGPFMATRLRRSGLVGRPCALGARP
jgi:hypothetical protein